MRLARTFLLTLCGLTPVGTPIVAHAAHAYVSNEDDHTVSVLDTDTGGVLATIPIGKRPRGLKVSHDGALLYVAVSGSPKCPPGVPDEQCAKLQHDVAADGIAVVDTATLKVVRGLKAGSDPEQFDLSRDGLRLFVSNEDSARLTVVDTARNTVITHVAVGHEPEGVRLTPNGEWVGVTSETDNSLSLIDTHLLQLIHQFKVGQRPRDLAYTADGRTAYVTGELDGSIYQVGIPEGKPVKQLLKLREGDRPMGIVLDPTLHRLYVSTGRGGSVAVIDPDRGQLVTEIAVGARPWGIALTPDHRLLFTANGSSNDVSIIDTQLLHVVRKVSVGRSPWGVAIGR